MEERIAGRICSFCCRDESGEEQEIIQYGITLLTESLLKTAALLFFGACIGKFWECLGFWPCFVLSAAMQAAFTARQTQAALQ